MRTSLSAVCYALGITKADAARVAANPGAYYNGGGQAKTKSYSKYDNCSKSQKSTAKESYSKAVASFKPGKSFREIVKDLPESEVQI